MGTLLLLALFTASFLPAGHLQRAVGLTWSGWKVRFMIALTLLGLGIGAFFVPLDAATRLALEQAERAAARQLDEAGCRRCRAVMKGVRFRCQVCGAMQISGMLIVFLLAALLLTFGLLFSGKLS